MARASQVGQAVLACPTCGLAANSTTSGVLRLISTLFASGIRRRHECPRHVMAQVNFPNYPKSPADIRSSESVNATVNH